MRGGDSCRVSEEHAVVKAAACARAKLTFLTFLLHKQ